VRRIYDSDAVVRDDDPHTPRERDEGRGSRSHVDWGNLSHALMPVRLRHLAVDVSVTTDRASIAPGDPVDVEVRLRNRLPFPVRLRTASPVLWKWAVDGVVEASEYDEGPAPEGTGVLSFGRSETKTFHRRWTGHVRRSERTWEPVEAGEHTVAAWVNVDDPAARGLRADTTVTVEGDA